MLLICWCWCYQWCVCCGSNLPPSSPPNSLLVPLSPVKLEAPDFAEGSFVSSLKLERGLCYPLLLLLLELGRLSCAALAVELVQEGRLFTSMYFTLFLAFRLCLVLFLSPVVHPLCRSRPQLQRFRPNSVSGREERRPGRRAFEKKKNGQSVALGGRGVLVLFRQPAFSSLMLGNVSCCGCCGLRRKGGRVGGLPNGLGACDVIHDRPISQPCAHSDALGCLPCWRSKMMAAEVVGCFTPRRACAPRVKSLGVV